MKLPDKEQIAHLQRFYRLQSRFYDWSRWCFLFGRQQLLNQVSTVLTPRSVLEVGCGTGSNLKRLAKLFPAAKLTGVDVSPDMLNIAKRKLQACNQAVALHNCAFDATFSLDHHPDLVLFSYSLSMMNPGWEMALQKASDLLADNGVIAVVDFDDTPLTMYRRYMASYHVRMDGHLLPALATQFKTIYSTQRSVYAGLWRYLMFIGKKVI